MRSENKKPAKSTRNSNVKKTDSAMTSDMKIDFFEKVANIIDQARKHIGRTVDLTMCLTYFEVGRMIVEVEQGGKTRAEYGRGLLLELAQYLGKRFGKGYSETNLRNARKFYQIYSQSIPLTISVESTNGDKGQIQQLKTAEFDITQKGQFPADFFRLSWTHYVVLIRIKNADERRFYEIEAENQGWTVETLKRQYASCLYERLALSRNKSEVMRLSKDGQIIEKPVDMLKNPLVLEFLGIDEKAEYRETDLETAIINKMQKFLLELGKGFLFEARQKRFSFDEEHFFVDLVLYNRLLQCYVLIDLKTDKLKHQDIGQMQMYVNYFDRYVKQDFEKPTVGILLCKEKKDSIVELTLPKDSNIYASAYALYLPDKALLQQKLAEWVEEFEEAQGLSDEEDDAI